MAYSESLLQDILEKTDLVDLIGGYVTLRANGQRWWGLCPFHQEKSPSFTVNPANHFFYCFGCQEKGNAFKFLMKIEHLSFTEAVKKLADKVGVALPTGNEPPVDKQKIALVELYGRLTKTFHHFLLTHPEAQGAREVLARRKVSSEMIERFQIGYALSDRFWLKKFLLQKQYDDDFLRSTGLFSANYPDLFLFAGRLLFPIRLATQETVGFGGRVMGADTGPKYLNSPESSAFQKRKTLYGWDQALPHVREKQELLLCEGYMDVIALHQSGVIWAVAPLGTAFTEDQAFLIKRYCRVVTCLFDSDDAGKKAAVRAVEICEPLELETRVVVVTSGKDPSEVLENEGEEAVAALLESRQKGFDFLLDYYYNAFNRNSPFDLKGFLREVFAFVSRIPSEVKQETYLARTAELLRVSTDALKKDFERKGDHNTVRALQKESQRGPQKPEGERSAEWRLLMAVLCQPDLYQILRRDLSPEDFEEPRVKKLVTILDERQDSDPGRKIPSLEVLSSQIEGEPWADLLFRDVSSGEYDLNTERFVQESVLRIKIRNLEKQKKRVRELLAQGLTKVEENQYLQEIKFLEEQIARLKGKV